MCKVCLCICMCFQILFLRLLFYHQFACFFISLLSLRYPLVFLSRDRKGMDLDGKRDGEERGGSGGRGNCNRNILYF